MQFNPVYLYSNKVDVFTEQLASWTTERYRKVYNRNLKIYKSVDNRIDIQVRNSDQKTMNITGSTLVFNLVVRDTQDLVFQKDFSAQDLATGKVTITLTEQELFDLDPGFYQYSVVKEIRQSINTTEYKVTSRLPLYVDSQYGVLANIEILGDVQGTVTPSQTINEFKLVDPTVSGESSPPPYYLSTIVDANLNKATADTMHTFQFYFNGYDGTVVIQANLDTQGATPRESTWSDVLSFEPTADVMYKNIIGKYNWFRIKHEPEQSSSTAKFVISQTISGNYNVGINAGGLGYSVGDTISFLGSNLGGSSPTHNLIITVTDVDSLGRIRNISWSGSSYNGVKTFVLSDTPISVSVVDKVLYR